MEKVPPPREDDLIVELGSIEEADVMMDQDEGLTDLEELLMGYSMEEESPGDSREEAREEVEPLRCPQHLRFGWRIWANVS